MFLLIRRPITEEMLWHWWLGDKMQLATLLFALDTEVSKVGVFLAASGALVLSTLIAVLVGSQLSGYIHRAF
jgi:putative Ca2+/H+ antiporter (TMEM165/GDT1 family)